MVDEEDYDEDNVSDRPKIFGLEILVADLIKLFSAEHTPVAA